MAWDQAVRGGDLVHGDESSFCDADFVDECFDGGLALGRAAMGGDEPGQVASLVAQDAIGWRGGLSVEGVGELAVAGVEQGALFLEGLEPGSGGDVA